MDPKEAATEDALKRVDTFQRYRLRALVRAEAMPRSFTVRKTTMTLDGERGDYLVVEGKTGVIYPFPKALFVEIFEAVVTDPPPAPAEGEAGAPA